MKRKLQTEKQIWKIYDDAVAELNSDPTLKRNSKRGKQAVENDIEICGVSDRHGLFDGSPGIFTPKAGNKNAVLDTVKAVTIRYKDKKELFILLKDFYSSANIEFKAFHLKKLKKRNKWLLINKTAKAENLCDTCRKLEGQKAIHPLLKKIF